MRALLLSTYDMGRQPFGLASPAAWLRDAGWDVVCVDTSRDRLVDEAIGADLIGLYLPMHTATRLASPLISRVRAAAPEARLCAYGLYAPLNAEWLRSLGVTDIFGGEFEGELTALARSLAGEPAVVAPSSTGRQLPRLVFMTPDRRGLPALDRYATLHLPDGSRRLVAYTEASRGCRHLCRHCPVVPVYQGQFRIVPVEVVLADITAQVAAGARHVTFGDPDFFNGPTHARRVVEALHAAHPDVTYDVTIKVEHLLAHRDLLPRLRDTGCAFITSAVESVDDRVLETLAKGHTRADFAEAVGLCRAAGVSLAPTFVAFHPWLTLEDYGDLLDTIASLDLVGHVAPIQLAIRLLLPEGSRLLELDEVRSVVQRFDPTTLTYQWTHADPRVDALQKEVASIVGRMASADRDVVFDEIRAAAAAFTGRPVHARPARARATVPYLNEPWYC